MAKVRVYELAKELGVESKVLLDFLKQQGEFVRSASSTIEPPVVRKIRETLPPHLTSAGERSNPIDVAPAPSRPAPPAPGAPATPAASAPTPAVPGAPGAVPGPRPTAGRPAPTAAQPPAATDPFAAGAPSAPSAPSAPARPAAAAPSPPAPGPAPSAPAAPEAPAASAGSAPAAPRQVHLVRARGPATTPSRPTRAWDAPVRRVRATTPSRQARVCRVPSRGAGSPALRVRVRVRARPVLGRPRVRVVRARTPA